MHRIHHQLQGWIDNGARFFGIKVGDEIGRTFDVGKQGGDAFAFAVGTPRASIASRSA